MLQAFAAELADHPQLERRLKALCSLHHPNLVAVVAAGTRLGSQHVPYTVLDWSGGRSLRDLLAEKGPLPIEAACAIAVSLLDALDHAHSAGLMHRDLKPAHVWVETRAHGHLFPRLFGFSLASSGGTRFRGSVAYAAPEQILGNQPTRRTRYAPSLWRPRGLQWACVR